MFNWSEIWLHMGPPALAVAGVLLVLGINYGWLLFMEPPHSTDES